MPVTIRDVARAAGVSPATVSRTFGQPAIVDAVTRERVLRVAEHLQYRPNRAARGLITGRTGNVGLLVPDIANPFFPSIIKAVQHQAHLADYQVFIVDTNEEAAEELALVRSLAKQVDGIILCSPRMRPAELREAASIVPAVLLHRTAGRLPAIAADNLHAMEDVVVHLSGLGHRRIGFIAGPRGSWSSRQRLTGLHRAASQHGVDLTEIGNFAPTFEGGAAALHGVLAAQVTAVVAYNDLVALGLTSALMEAGIDVPGHLSVVGVDDIPMSAMVQPALTTVAIPQELSGRASIDLLMQLFEEPSSPAPPIELLPTSLVVRGTTAPPPGAPVSSDTTAQPPT